MISLVDAHKKFINDLKKKSRAEATTVAYSKDIIQLIAFLDKEKIKNTNEVKLDDLNKFMQSLADEGLKNKTISRKTNSTRTFFKYLRAENLVDINPSQNLEHPEVKSHDPRILSKLEYRSLRDAVRKDIRTAAIVELFLQTGIRIGELARLNLTEVKLNGGKGEIYISEFGSHEARVVPLNDAAEEAISEYILIRPTNVKSENFFITKTGKPLLVRNIRATLNRYFEKAELSHVKVNDLRHTFIAHHLTQGTNLLTISKIAGHKRISTTEKYLNFIKNPGTEKIELEEL
jgi:integrase/recombinase XerD